MKAKIIIAAVCLLIAGLLYLQINIDDAKNHVTSAVAEQGGPKQKTIKMPDPGVTDAGLVGTVGSVGTPGVYIEEIPVSLPIVGVETSVAGFAGQTERGPAEPQLVTSYAQFESIYGGRAGSSFLAYEVKGFFENGGQSLYVVRVIPSGALTAKRALNDMKRGSPVIEALSPGQWGNRVSVKVSAGAHSTPKEPTFKLEVAYYDSSAPVAGIEPIKGKPAQTVPKLTEVFQDVSLSPASAYAPNKTVNASSKLVRVVPGNGSPVYPKADNNPVYLSGGNDGGPATLDDYLGNSDSRGLRGLGAIDEIGVLYSPDAGGIQGLSQAMIDQCQNLGDRIVLLDSALGDADPDPMNELDSSYAAFYSPWLQVADSSTSQNILVPPGGFIAGTYAQNDLLRGVWRSPANLVIKGAIGVERAITRNEQDDLYFKNINPIINSSGRGILAYGARTLTSNLEYRYIAVRRYLNYIKESVAKGLGWVVFEPWDAALQNKVKNVVSDFLYQEWKRGALLGNKPEEAYFTSVYALHGGQSDNAAPEIYLEIGLALLKPAEFHTIKLSIQ